MAIPPGTKFHGVAPGVDTADLGSVTVQALRDVYLIEDFGSPLTSTIELSPAQMLALDTTPIEVVPAQGTGKSILVVSAWMKLFFNSVPYDFPSGTEFGLSPMPFDYPNNYYFTQSQFITSPTSIESSSDIWFLSNTGNLNTWTTAPLLENMPLSLYSSEAPVSLDGDSTIQLKVYYRIIE